ncbi:hypothetical protein [Sandaracinus amylolyticus]|uniref:Uncharacterized protein n=1 Tax=Sandaracinus amylolyticus TaxID=927083 RepID=A0A0F6W6I6_9BACT|nr:hypothetical protein [Sandaracinus amylolyticus]AKF08680.1 hypothetical protein DB32_005829 [Sandaracinus amylolyticus]
MFTRAGLVACVAAQDAPPLVMEDHSEVMLAWGSVALVVAARTPRLARWFMRARPVLMVTWGEA